MPVYSPRKLWYKLLTRPNAGRGEASKPQPELYAATVFT